MMIKEAKKKSEFQKLKDNEVPLTKEEKAEVKAKGAMWNSGWYAVWKSVDPKTGDTTYVTNTHRAYNARPTLKGAISRFHNFIKSTASYEDGTMEKIADERTMMMNQDMIEKMSDMLVSGLEKQADTDMTDKEKSVARQYTLGGLGVGAGTAAALETYILHKMSKGYNKVNDARLESIGIKPENLIQAREVVPKGDINLPALNAYFKAKAPVLPVGAAKEVAAAKAIIGDEMFKRRFAPIAGALLMGGAAVGASHGNAAAFNTNMQSPERMRQAEMADEAFNAQYADFGKEAAAIYKDERDGQLKADVYNDPDIFKASVNAHTNGGPLSKKVDYDAWDDDMQGIQQDAKRYLEDQQRQMRIDEDLAYNNKRNDIYHPANVPIAVGALVAPIAAGIITAKKKPGWGLAAGIGTLMAETPIVSKTLDHLSEKARIEAGYPELENSALADAENQIKEDALARYQDKSASELLDVIYKQAADDKITKDDALLAGTGAMGVLAKHQYDNGNLTGRETLYHNTRAKDHASVLDKGVLAAKANEPDSFTRGVLKDIEPDKLNDLTYFARKKPIAQAVGNTRFQRDMIGQVGEAIAEGDLKKGFHDVKQSIKDNHGKTIKARVPIDKEHVENPELRGAKSAHEFRQKLKEANPAFGFAPEALQKQQSEYAFRTLGDKGTRVFKGDVGPEAIKGSKHYKGETLGEIGAHIKKHPAKFAKGVAPIIGTAALGAMTAKTMYDKKHEKSAAEIAGDVILKQASLL